MDLPESLRQLPPLLLVRDSILQPGGKDDVLGFADIHRLEMLPHYRL